MDSAEKFLQRAADSSVIPVVDTMPADLLTPLAVYLKLSKNQANSFLLESVAGGESLARYSFIGAGPASVVRGDDRSITLSDTSGEKTVPVSMMDHLREHFENNLAVADEELPAFTGGVIGYLGFSCSEWFEPSLRRKGSEEAVIEDAAFMFFRSVIAFDHAKQVIKIISLVFAREAEGDEERLRELYETARGTNKTIKAVLESDPASLPVEEIGNEKVEIVSNWERPAFERAVAQIKELIVAGECYQVVLSQCFSRKTSASPVSIYRGLRSMNPSPYMFLLRFEDRSVIGASPEMLVRCRGRDLEYRPIAGTRPRGKTTEEDGLLAEEMLADKKEVAEHLMLVDLGRNDLGRVAQFGSIAVESLMNVEKYSHVQHLVSSIRGRLRDGLDRFDALAACFPAGTVSGAPKVRAIEIIREIEPTARGVYSGAVGYFDYAGNMDTCIAIRTLVLEDGVAKVQAGAGIVADSVPEKEFEETVNKAAALLRTMEMAEGRGDLS